jgi:hypothetical protein
VGGLALAAQGGKSAALDRIEDLTLLDVKAERVTWRGKSAVRLTEPVLNQGGGIAIVKGPALKNGTIDAQIAGQPITGAAEGARGFVGLAFRVQQNPLRYECFYIRPTNGRADDQLRRNHATQYISEPEFPWQRLRKEFPGVYESYADMEPGAWTAIRITVDGVKARLFINGAAQPALIVNDLKLGDIGGPVALWIGQGTDAYFADLVVTSAVR